MLIDHGHVLIIQRYGITATHKRAYYTILCIELKRDDRLECKGKYDCPPLNSNRTVTLLTKMLYSFL